MPLGRKWFNIRILSVLLFGVSISISISACYIILYAVCRLQNNNMYHYRSITATGNPSPQ